MIIVSCLMSTKNQLLIVFPYDNAFNLENYIITQFGKALGNAEEDAFLNGDGSGKPLGLFTKVIDATTGAFKNSTFSTEVSTKTGNVPDIKTDDILSLIYSLKRPYRKKASFIMNDSTLAAIRKLKDLNGAYIWQPSYQAGEPDRLRGYTVHTSAFCPEMPVASPLKLPVMLVSSLLAITATTTLGTVGPAPFSSCVSFSLETA